MAAIDGVSQEELLENLTPLGVIDRIKDLVTDEEFLAFFSSSATGAE